MSKEGKLAIAAAVSAYAVLFVFFFMCKTEITNIDLTEWNNGHVYSVSSIPADMIYSCIYTVQCLFKFLDAFWGVFGNRKVFEFLMLMVVQLFALGFSIGIAATSVYGALTSSKWNIVMFPISFFPMIMFAAPTNLILYCMN